MDSKILALLGEVRDLVEGQSTAEELVDAVYKLGEIERLLTTGQVPVAKETMLRVSASVTFDSAQMASTFGVGGWADGEMSSATVREVNVRGRCAGAGTRMTLSPAYEGEREWRFGELLASVVVQMAEGAARTLNDAGLLMSVPAVLQKAGEVLLARV